MSLPSRHPSSRTPRARGRLAVAAVAGVVAAGGLVLLPSAAQAAPDPAPNASLAGWVRGQLQGGLLQDPSATVPGSPDVPASLDAALGFLVSGDAATSATVRDALGAVPATTPATQSPVAAYAAPGNDGAPDPLARSSWFAGQLGADPKNYGGLNLVQSVRDRIDVTTGSPTLGRLSDTSTSSATPADPTPETATVTGQAYAVGALVRAAATDPTYTTAAGAATTYLTNLQCADGFFLDALPAAAPAAQTCTAGATASVATTAAAVVTLTDVPAAKPARDRAVAWLVKVQQDNGRWTPTGNSGPGDALTTSLASYAVSLAARPNPAVQGALWLRGQQLVRPGSCAGPADADLGAVAPDGSAFDAATATPVAASSAAVRAAYRRAGARSLLTLRNATLNATGADNQLSLAQRFSRPGQPVVATFRAAPRSTVCATAPGLAATRVLLPYDGSTTVTFPAAADGPTTLSVVDASGQTDTATVTTLAARKLGLTLKSKRVRAGQVAVAKVSGLAAGETVGVKFRGSAKNSAVANSAGKAKLRFKVGRQRGQGKVKVAGLYGDRKASTFLTVTRRR